MSRTDRIIQGSSSHIACLLDEIDQYRRWGLGVSGNLAADFVVTVGGQSLER